MTGTATTHFLVTGVFCDASCVASCGTENPLNLPKTALRAPKATHAKLDGFE